MYNYIVARRYLRPDGTETIVYAKFNGCWTSNKNDAIRVTLARANYVTSVWAHEGYDVWFERIPV